MAPQGLEVQAAVVSKMLEHAGLLVTREMMDTAADHRHIVLSHPDGRPEEQPWDTALTVFCDPLPDNKEVNHGAWLGHSKSRTTR